MTKQEFFEKVGHLNWINIKDDQQHKMTNNSFQISKMTNHNFFLKKLSEMTNHIK